MKKNYICPEVNVYKVQATSHLCGSIGNLGEDSELEGVYGNEKSWGETEQEADSRMFWDD